MARRLFKIVACAAKTHRALHRRLPRVLPRNFELSPGRFATILRHCTLHRGRESNFFPGSCLSAGGVDGVRVKRASSNLLVAPRAPVMANCKPGTPHYGAPENHATS